MAFLGAAIYPHVFSLLAGFLWTAISGYSTQNYRMETLNRRRRRIGGNFITVGYEVSQNQLVETPAHS
jgi:hypothetical protein